MFGRKKQDSEELFEKGYELYKAEDEKSLTLDPEILKLFEKSSRLKNPKASFYLGYFLVSGYKDVEINKRKGERILKKAIPLLKELSEGKHDPVATRLISKYYEIPLLSFVHDEEKIKSLNALAELYENEKGLNKDTLKETDYRTYKEADEKEKTSYDELLHAIEALEKGTESAEDSIIHIDHSARNGNIRACVYLGMLYLEGKYVERDPVKAKAYLRKGEDEGSLKAKFIIGREQVEGNFSSQDIIGGLNRIYAAAKAGLPEAQFYLGKVYYEGKIVEKDLDKAYIYFQASSTRGIKKAAEYMRKIQLSKGDRLLISTSEN